MRQTIDSIGKIYYPIIAVIGVPVNLLTIMILSRGKCGLSTCTTRYLVAMATADLLLIIIEVILGMIHYYYFPVSFLDITPVCSVILVLNHTFTECSVWFTITFTFDRFVAICCQKLKTKYCTEKTATVVLATTSILLCLKNIPIFFKYEPGEINDNLPWFCVAKPSYFTDPGWVGFARFDTVLTPLIPFALILLLNVLTVRHILVASRVRKGLRGQNKGENHSDPEMESRRKSVILLFTISGNFIFLWLVYVLYYLNITYHFDDDSSYLFGEVGFMLQNLSCCTNTFIYVVTQSKFREQVKSAVKYPRCGKETRREPEFQTPTSDPTQPKLDMSSGPVGVGSGGGPLHHYMGKGLLPDLTPTGSDGMCRVQIFGLSVNKGIRVSQCLYIGQLCTISLWRGSFTINGIETNRMLETKSEIHCQSIEWGQTDSRSSSGKGNVSGKC
ncbi:probable G-protein coupled receptor 139 [Heterodontus francisci]|uniref:probable G-protein coupled receptor 139 n=1 Tax=Heterodontus francisci TaxID=7792 RepID=UPI00355BD164